MQTSHNKRNLNIIKNMNIIKKHYQNSDVATISIIQRNSDVSKCFANVPENCNPKMRTQHAK